MIQYLQRRQIDDARWDTVIAGAVNGLPYAYSWYLDVVSPNWQALVLNDYEAVFPLTRRSKFGISYLFPPFFTQQLGIFSTKEITPEMVQLMLASIPSKFPFIEINLNYANHCLHPAFVLIPRVNMVLPLNKPYEEIRKGYNDNLRRNLQKGDKHNLAVKTGIDGASAGNFFRQYLGDKVENLKEDDYETLEKLAQLLVEKKMGQTYYVTNGNDEILATALFIHSHNRHINLLPAANQAGKEVGATALLLDHIIRQHANTDTLMDFEGSLIVGIARFYRGFGAEDVPYFRLSRSTVPWYIRMFK